MNCSAFELSNGLRVIHNRDGETGMVSMDMIYDVGSRDENPDRTGLAHLLEHLLCGPSEVVHDPDNVLEQAGAKANAWTNADNTDFTCLIPAVNIETALWVESNRMAAPLLDARQIEIQKGVVIEEFKERCLNQPYGDLQQLVHGLVYTEHHYRWTTLGLMPEHIRDASQQDVRDFFERHYSPDSAVLAVSGNIDAGRLRDLAEQYFGDIPRREVVPHFAFQEPALTADRRQRVYRHVPNAVIVMAYHIPAAYEQGYAECDLITDILAAGRGSLFYNSLLTSDSNIISADAYVSSGVDCGELYIIYQLDDDSDSTLAAMEHRVRAILTGLAEKRLTEDELRRYRTRCESRTLFDSINITTRSNRMATAAIRGRHPDDDLDNIRRVTPESLQQMARSLFTDGYCAILEYLTSKP